MAYGLLLVLLAGHVLHAQTTPVGQLARDFTLTNRLTGQPLRLSDYAGDIIVLDFFTYWCSFCQQSSPVIEQEVQQFYQAQKGNPAGLPVRVISINLEIQNPPGTDRFIKDAGLELVADDFARAAFNQFVFPEERVATLFAIINGVPNANYPQWEVLYRTNSFEGVTPFRTIIDSIKNGGLAPPSITSGPISQAVAIGTPVTFSISASGSAPLFFQWYKDGIALPGITNSTLFWSGAGSRNTGAYSVTVSNAVGVAHSPQALLSLIAPPRITNLRYTGGTIAFDLLGTAGQSYMIQSSSNLFDWTAGVSLAATTNGHTNFQDSPGCVVRFYRAIVR